MNLWTDDQKDMLSRLYAAGSTFGAIVSAINERFGTSYTRNAAISRAHRMKLPTRQSPIKPKPEVAAPKAKKTDRIRVAPGAQVQAINRGPKTTGDGYNPKTVEVATLDIRLVDLEPTQCRFACVRIDDEWRFCGHQKKAGSSFCADHHALCWNPRVAPIVQRPHFRDERRRVTV